ncbi:hypothetical protein H0I23_12835 [Cellulophaga sp. HaHaR_3_176]|uniref:sugar-transfer associated ATP-grasp domain-containing protein n=1 Tax=Cellulophaga sp. HaHaR_3_176 TaxID=1942464 RepID=UPI001C20030F|nr:sugar-transfer associated ATP-grasp domain-containing protein [Cellulophaga sp. HaHaR_3_176]QWX83333.1 hypothetical protein H0I23_12835 [Cellulophaga sp. HaHaR_3_176]
MGVLKEFTKANIEKLEAFRFHKISNAIATSTLQHLTEEKGIFSPLLKKRADEYALDVLGWKGFAPWLYVYSHFTGEFREGWIPDNYYAKIVIPKIQGDYGQVSMLKPLTNRLFEQRITPDLGYYINGKWFDANYYPIQEKEVQSLFFSEADKVICKLDKSYQGKGIYILDKKNFKTSTIKQLGNCVIQNFIQQHNFFNDFTPKSVATIRLTTVVESDNKISLRAAYLRLGRKNNTHVASEDHIRIPIDMTTGTLDAIGYLPNWHQIETHPDNQVSFLNKKIPNFQACIALTQSLHQKMPMVVSIGWDVVVNDKNTPVVMEWNGYSNDIKFSEATQGPCFKNLGWNKLRI